MILSAAKRDEVSVHTTMNYGVRVHDCLPNGHAGEVEPVLS
jgi:hypothetical protein